MQCAALFAVCLKKHTYCLEDREREDVVPVPQPYSRDEPILVSSDCTDPHHNRSHSGTRAIPFPSGEGAQYGRIPVVRDDPPRRRYSREGTVRQRAAARLLAV